VHRRMVAVTLVGLIGAAVGGCGPYDITAPRLDTAVAQTFTNLYAYQQTLLGTEARVREVRASCTKAGGGAQVGAGDGWSCTVTYLPENSRLQSVTYDMTLQADGCFAAMGPPGVVGSATEESVGGRSVVNPLFAFDGCFDTT
jgi:hypothetical protein